MNTPSVLLAQAPGLAVVRSPGGTDLLALLPLGLLWLVAPPL